MIKFRTMTLDAEAAPRRSREREERAHLQEPPRRPQSRGWAASCEARAWTKRRNLFNVLLGQMSLVGPRPPIGEEVAQYEPWQRRRLSVKPGLTCLWQVSGRSEIDFEDWMRMDLWYVRHQSWSTDLDFCSARPGACSPAAGRIEPGLFIKL